MIKVVIADPVHPESIEMLTSNGITVRDVSSEKEKLMNSLEDAEGLIVRSATKVTKKFLSQCPKLKIIGRSGVGLDNIDQEECKKRGIEIVNSPEGPTQSVAELTLGLIIAAARKFGVVISGTKNGDWPKKERGIELHGKTLGIIGSGAIGGAIAKYALALGMKVISYDIIEYEDLKELEGFRYVSLDQLLENSSVISIHVPLLPATKHMLDTKAFSKMKEGVIIINTSRGGVIDETALYQALDDGKVKAVGLDVYESEPVNPQSPLISHPLVVTTPHIGAQTPEASKKNSTIVAQKMIDYLNSI